MRIPTPGATLAKALLLLVVAIACFVVAREVATVRLTRIADGEISRTAVPGGDPIYRHEIEQARKRALPLYGLSAVAGLAGLVFVRKSVRRYRLSRLA